MTTRLMPPPSGPFNITVHGRSYTCPSGSTVDVPDQDAIVMTANGWTTVSSGGVGTTAQRPAPTRGAQFHDTTLGKIVVADGKTWRDSATGAAV